MLCALPTSSGVRSIASFLKRTSSLLKTLQKTASFTVRNEAAPERWNRPAWNRTEQNSKLEHTQNSCFSGL